MLLLKPKSREMTTTPSSKSRLKDWLVVKFFVWLIRLTGLTSKTVQLDEAHLEPLQGNYILATWHNNIYFSCWLLKNREYGSMISQSRDGELIARVMEHFAFVPIRGSSSEGGTRALREMVKYLKGPYPAAITPDGPLGPRHKVQSGVIMIAKMTGIPIIPWDYEALDQWIIEKSWDRHKIPKPFTLTLSAFGPPLHVPAKLSSDELEAYCEKLEHAIQENHQRISAKMEQLRQAGADRFIKKVCLMWTLKNDP